MDVDTRDLQRLERDLEKKAEALEHAIPDLIIEGIKEARQELKPVWTSEIGILPTTPFPTARILARKGGSRLVSVRPASTSTTPQRRKAGASGSTRRPSTSGSVGGRERIAPDAAVVVAAIRKRLASAFQVVVTHGS